MLVGTWKKLLEGRRHRIRVQPRSSSQGVKKILQAGSLHYRTSRTSTYKRLEALPVSNGILSSDVAVALTYEEQAGREGNRLLSQGLTSRMTRTARRMTSKQCGRRQEAERVRGWIPAPLEVSAGSLASQARIGLLTIWIGAEALGAFN